MLYHHYEMQRLALAPMRALASNMLGILELPGNPMRKTHLGRVTAAMLDSFEHSTRQFGKPTFGHDNTIIDGEAVPVVEEAVLSRPWIELKRFRRLADRPNDPPVLIVAPMSGHYATLRRGTVKAMLPDHDIYITDWSDARMVPMAAGRFDLIGVGGIGSGADAYAKIRAGAAAVQLYSALVFEGPGLVTRIKRDLAARLRADGFSSVKAAVGAA